MPLCTPLSLYCVRSLELRSSHPKKYRYYFVEGHALNDKPRLAKVAAESLVETLAKAENTDTPPMTEDEVLNFLNSNEGRPEIENALRALTELGVHSIPKFIIEGARVVDGAATPDVFIKVFRLSYLK